VRTWVQTAKKNQNKTGLPTYEIRHQDESPQLGQDWWFSRLGIVKICSSGQALVAQACNHSYSGGS
jgi:hypothetical protein